MIFVNAPNNSFNRTRNELAFHRKLVRIGGLCAPVNSGVRFPRYPSLKDERFLLSFNYGLSRHYHY